MPIMSVLLLKIVYKTNIAKNALSCSRTEKANKRSTPTIYKRPSSAKLK